MLESIKDLELSDLDQDANDFWDKFNSRLKEKLGIGVDEIKEALSSAIIKSAEELALELPNIAPYGDYEKLLEDNDSMTAFLREEASKLENLTIYTINEDDKQKQLLRFVVICTAVDDGESLKGFVFVSRQGVIRHAFAQVET